MRKLFILLFLFVTIGLSFSETINVSTFFYPGYMHEDEIDGIGYGLLPDLLSAAYGEEGIDTAIEFSPLLRAKESLLKKQVNAELGTILHFQGEERNQVDFINFGNARFVFFYSKSKFPNGITYSDLSELSKYKIGNIRGSSSIKVLEESGLNLVLVNEIPQLIQMLDTGRIDLFVGIDLAIRYLLYSDFSNMKSKIGEAEEDFLSIPLNVLFLKSDSKSEYYKSMLESGIEKIKANGVYDKIIQKYTYSK